MSQLRHLGRTHTRMVCQTMAIQRKQRSLLRAINCVYARRTSTRGCGNRSISEYRKCQLIWA